MKIQWNARSIVGLLLAVFAAVSLVIDAAGIIQIWVLREPVTQDAINTLDVLNGTLDTTAQGLTIAKTSLKSVTVTLGALQTTVQSAAATIATASTSVNSVSSVIGKNLSETVTSALGTLDVVQATTQTIDGVLSGLANIPLLNITYDPSKPLSASVSDLTDQLKQVPLSLNELEKNLATSGTSLDKVGRDATELAGSLGQVQADLDKLVGVLEQYETQVKALRETVRNLRENIVTILWGLLLFTTFVLLWLGVTMVQTLWNGLEWMGQRPTWFDPPHKKTAH